MKWPFRKPSLRRRLTVLYGAVFGILLLLHAGVATFVHDRQLVRQVYHGEIQDIETAEGLLYQTPDGRVLMHEDYFNQPRMPLQLERYLEVLDTSGNILFRNSKLGAGTIGGSMTQLEGVGTYNERVDQLSDGRSVYVVSHAHALNGCTLILRLAYDRAPISRNVLEFAVILLVFAPLTVIVAAFVVFETTSSALAPLRAMMRRAERITAQRLNERLPAEGADADLGQVAHVFNALLQRLEDSFSQLKRFTADASHELRTPLSSLRSMGEVGLQKKRSGEVYRDTLANMLEEINRMTQLVDSLLMISRADSGQISLNYTDVSLREMVQECIALVEILAEEKQQRIHFAAGENLLVHADRTILRQAIVNLLDNAIKYSPEQTEIIVAVNRSDSSFATVEIRDRGIGIPVEMRQRIFDRFYRTDEGRSAARGGAGLGLSIAKWAIEAHHGVIGVDANTEGGSCFYFRIPLRK